MKKLLTLFTLLPSFCFAQWTQVGNSITGQAANDRCGSSTAISSDGSIVAIGSSSSSSGFANAGQVRIFENINNTWTQIGSAINGESSGDQTGQAVSLSADGSIVAIGEPFNNDLGFTSGQVRVFQNINNNWSQIGQDLYGENAVAEGGKSVDLSSDGIVLAFGAPNTAVNGVSFAGKVRVFENQNNTWVQKGEDINGDGSIIKFGASLDLSTDGNTIAIGHTGDPTNFDPADTGRVKVYRYEGGEWVQLGNTIFADAAQDEFGYRVSLSVDGTMLAVGTFGTGYVKIFELNNGAWSQMGNTLTGNSPGDRFGFALSLSENGSHLAVGARFINLNNDQPGSAYIFENQGGSWVLVGEPIVGAAIADQAGASVAIAEDGLTVAVGSIGNDDAGSNAGHVRVFELDSTSDVGYVSEQDSWVNVAPNPAIETIKIRSGEVISSYSISSIDGALVKQANNIHQSEFDIDLQNSSSGIYIITLQTKNSTRSLKFVKE